MKLALINPYKISKQLASASPPYNLAVLASYIRKHEPNIEIKIIDGLAGHNIEEGIKDYRPDIIAITSTTPTIIDVYNIADLLKEKYIVIIGGVHATCMPEEAKEHCHYVITGEGEIAFLELLRNIKQGQKPKEGIIDSSLIKNLDDIPLAAYDLIDMDYYINSPDNSAETIVYAPKGSVALTVITCYDDKTEVLTQRGWKFFNQLTKEDKVATLNAQTDSLEYHYPRRIIKQSYEGEMYKIKNTNIDLLITPNHEVYVKKTGARIKENRVFGLHRIKDVANVWQLRAKRNAKWQGIEKDYFELPQIIQGSPTQINKDKILMKDWVEFMGYYLADGSYTRKLNNRYIIKIAKTRSKHKKVYDKIKKCIKKLGYNFYEIKESENHGGGFEISNKQLFMYLKQFGKALSKYIPQDIKLLSKKYLQIFMDAFISCDGYITISGQMMFFSSSKNMIDDLQEILLKIGLSGNIIARSPQDNIIKGKLIKKENCSVNYRLGVVKSMNEPYINLKNKNDITIQNYKGIVYCCEVLNHIIYVRRNGIPCWSGNSRGCVFKCSFCHNSWRRTPTRYHSAERVIEEIEYLRDNYGIESFFFADDEFIINKKRFIEFARLIKEKNIKIHWACQARADITLMYGLEILQLMKESGCTLVSIGAESGNQRVLKLLKCDNTTVKMNRDAIDLIKKSGMKVSASFMVGTPSETKEEMLDTLNFILDANLDSGGVGIATPYPKTGLWNMAVERGLIPENVDYAAFLPNNDPERAFIVCDTMTKKEFIKLYTKIREKVGRQIYYNKILSGNVSVFKTVFQVLRNRPKYVLSFPILHPILTWRLFIGWIKPR